jgi:hypothetical protein
MKKAKKNLVRQHKGLLNSSKYFEVLKLFKHYGINYCSHHFGFDRYYFNEGLYRITPDKVYLVFAFNMFVPMKCQHLSLQDCHPRLRLQL